MGCSGSGGGARPIGSAALVGRDPEIAQLAALVEAVAPGRPTVVILHGPSGSGRTRLLEELALLARRRGATVLLESEWAGAAGARGVLHRERDGSGPLVFLCDHPVRIDERVWAILELLAESVPVLIALTARPGADPRPADHLVAPLVCRVRLAALAPDEVRELVGVLVGAPAGPELVDLSRVAAGRPGAVRDLIIGLREEGLLRPVARRPVLTAVRLPGRTRARVVDQLAAMSPPARHLLQAATTLRSPFPLVRLTRLLQVSPVLVLPAIDEVLESGLLTGDNEVLRFSHELVRPIVESSMPRPVVAALRDDRARDGRARDERARDERARDERARDRRQNPKRLRAAPSKVVRPRSPADWGLLTAREQEIAGFVGRALTNQQIATQIDRSPHTVNYHLRQIFQKLGLTSRVELASLVRQRDAAGPAGLPSAGPSSK